MWLFPSIYIYAGSQKRIEIKKLLMYTNETLCLWCVHSRAILMNNVQNRRTEERRNKTHISTKNTLSGSKLCLQHDLNKYALSLFFVFGETDFCFCSNFYVNYNTWSQIEEKQNVYVFIERYFQLKENDFQSFLIEEQRRRQCCNINIVCNNKYN